MNKIQLTPRQWGWKQNYLATWQEALIQKPSLRGLFPARIIGREHHSYTIVFPDFWAEFDGLMPAFGIDKEHSGQTTPGIYQDIRVRGRFEHEALSAADYPVCGDWVLIDTAAQTPRIEHVLERHTSLSRASSGTATEEQVLAANIDVLLLVFALHGGRNFLERLLERSLVVAHASGAMPWILLNKADLADSETRETALAIAAHIAPSVPVTLLSAKKRRRRTRAPKIVERRRHYRHAG
jgi:putative ribosome biogenesis GTPase RsgA